MNILSNEDLSDELKRLREDARDDYLSNLDDYGYYQREKGREEGRRIGIEKARNLERKEQRRLTIKDLAVVLTNHFGVSPNKARSVLDDLSLDKLNSLFTVVFEVSSFDEFLTKLS